MKRFIAKVVFGLSLLAPTTVLAASGYVTGDVNMRSGPGTQYASLRVLPEGSTVSVLNCQSSSWCQVSAAGTRGWVSKRYVSTAAYAPRNYGARRYDVAPIYPLIGNDYGWRHRPGFYRPGWNRPGYGHRPGWNRPTWNRPGIGGHRPGGWNRPTWNRPGMGGHRPGGWNRPNVGGHRPGGWNRPNVGGHRPGGWNRPNVGGHRPGGWNRPNVGGHRPGGGNRPGGWSGGGRHRLDGRR